MSTLTPVRLAALVACTLAVVGCGSDSKSSTPDAGASATSAAAAAATTAGATGTTAAAAAAASGDPVKIMQIATLTGPSDNVPQDNDAAKAAVKALNAAGGVQGRPLELVTCDDKFDPNAAAECARKAVSEKVAAVVALNSGFGDKVIPILAAAGIPSVGDNLISGAEFVSPIVYPISGGAITGTSAMAYAVAHAGATKIRPMVVDIAAAKGLLPFIQGTAALFPEATMLKDIPVPPQATDVTSQASSAAADGADGAFFVVGAGAAATLTRAMRTAGFEGVLASGTQSITQQEIKDLGDQADGLLLVSAMPPPTYTQNSSVKQFTDDLEAAGGSDALSGGMLLAWASVKVAAMGLEKAATLDAPGLKAALDSYGEITFPGLGSWDYSKPLAAYGGKLRIFNPDQYISKVDADGNLTPIDPEPFDVTQAPPA